MFKNFVQNKLALLLNMNLTVAILYWRLHATTDVVLIMTKLKRENKNSHFLTIIFLNMIMGVNFKAKKNIWMNKFNNEIIFYMLSSFECWSAGEQDEVVEILKMRNKILWIDRPSIWY